jgi:hypothetical protein
MSDSKIEINVPTQLIEDMVRAKIVEQITEGGGKELVRRIVEQACDAKKASYCSQTRLQEAFEEMIRDEAKKIMKLWIEENRELLKASFMEELTKRKNARIKQLADSLITQMAGFNVSLRLEAPRD